jgi:hypothetical protein
MKILFSFILLLTMFVSGCSQDLIPEPINLTAVSEEAGQVKLSWNGTLSPCYICRYEYTGDDSSTIITIDQTSGQLYHVLSPFTISNLESGKEYGFFVDNYQSRSNIAWCIVK